MEQRMIKGRVLVAMSGGMDSTAACLILQRQGYDVQGITFRLWERNQKTEEGKEESLTSTTEVQLLAKQLSIPLYVVDLREVFKEKVVGYFCSSYLRGETPNPCVVCNKHIKWHFLIKYAEELGCEWIATGHYAQIVKEEDKYFIEKGRDALKDQSYFLWQLGEKELSKTLFPLGGMTKEEVKKMLFKAGIVFPKEQKESMDICFVEGDYRDFLSSQILDLTTRIGKGNFINSTGERLGEHKGFPFYTIGQRRKLGIALGTPAFVTQILPQTNEIRLGNLSELVSTEMRIRDAHFPSPKLLKQEGLKVKIRYRSPEIPCDVEEGNGEVIVTFKEAASSVTAGQSAVFYQDNRVVGGGVIL